MAYEQQAVVQPDSSALPLSPRRDVRGGSYNNRIACREQRLADYNEAQEQLMVDGVMRPMCNNFGGRIAGSLEALRKFWRWFGDSYVVDEQGRPLVVYHGTGIRKSAFRREGGCAGVGAYFTDDYKVAKEYADMDASVDGTRPIVMSVYLALSRPIVVLDMESQSVSSERRDQLEADGFDSMIGGDQLGGREFIAFRPEQIKSVNKNCGDFDPRNPCILR